MPFFSQFDERAKPKGSRDPLGFEVVWSHFGRRLVGNLTTITSSVVNFKVALLGFVCAHELSENQQRPYTTEQIRHTFLRYEQLAAYLRLDSGNASSLMGITRAKTSFDHLQDGKRVTLSSSIDAQILSNQASYGLWGLYSTALRQAALLKGDLREPTELARTLVTAMLGSNSDLKEALKSYIGADQSIAIQDVKGLSKRFGDALRNQSADRDLVRQLLTFTHEDEQLRNVYEGLFSYANEWIKETHQNDGSDLSRSHLLHSLAESDNALLARRAQDILKVEPVLVFCNVLFDFLRSQIDSNLGDVCSTLTERWSLLTVGLPEALPAESFPHKKILADILHHAHSVDEVPLLLRKLLEHNKSIMANRGGAPWVELDGQNKLKVKVSRETYWLPDASSSQESESMIGMWSYDYFLGSYLSVLHEANPAQ